MLAAPSEINIGGVYMPPLLVSGVLGLLVTYYLVKLLSVWRVLRHFAAPDLVFIALFVIFTSLIETFFVMG